MRGKGYKFLQADGLVSTSGEPVAIYAVNIIGNGSATTVTFRNGTSASGTAVLKISAAANVTTNADFGGVGIVFPDGCFVDFDATTQQVTTVFERIL